ncbi:MAG: DUF4129 domain-containing protein [Mycobacteriales bacterium]
MTSALLVVEEITRNGARDAAREELSKGIYQAQRPGLVEQLLNRAAELLAKGVDRAGEVVPGGTLGLVILALLLIGAVIAIRLRTGPLARSARAGGAFGGFGQPLSPAEHRRRADEHETAGRYAEAIRERLRAIARDLEVRVILEPRLGRTADEFAYEGGLALPGVAQDLQRAARTFDDVWYGGRSATPAMAADLRTIDRRVQDSRPAAARLPPQPQLALPR